MRWGSWPAGRRGSPPAAAGCGGGRRHRRRHLIRQHRGARRLRPHRCVMGEGAFAPLGYRLGVQPMLDGELFERRFCIAARTAVRGRGAAVENLSHNASRKAGSAKLIPPHSGTRHLGSKLRPTLSAGKSSPQSATASPKCEHTVGGKNGVNWQSQRTSRGRGEPTSIMAAEANWIDRTRANEIRGEG